MWGGTTYSIDDFRTVFISIHPPRVGWDREILNNKGVEQYFNPPTPCGVGRRLFVIVPRFRIISIHPPRVGWDGRSNLHRESLPISIHPPRVGWDFPTFTVVDKGFEFQSTHPVWGGTISPIRAHAVAGISIHPPRVGWDRNITPETLDGFRFQSTHPVWGGTMATVRILPALPFQSTHPVWGGTLLVAQQSIPRKFQSTHPVWGGTAKVYKFNIVP